MSNGFVAGAAECRDVQQQGVELGGHIGGGLRVGDSADNVVQGRVAGYTKTYHNLRFDDASGHLYVNLFVNNAENSRITTNVVPVWSSTTANYALPRTYGVRVGFKY